MRTLSRRKKRIADRLKVVIGEISQREFARIIKISPSTLWEYLNGRIPPADFIVRVCERYGISEKWLLTGRGPRHQKNIQTGADTGRVKDRDHPVSKAESKTRLKSTAGSSEEYVVLPKNKTSYGPGFSEIILSKQIVNHLAFSPHWIKEMRLEAKQLALISLIGNSTEPTIKEGDMALIDLRKNGGKNTGLYAIRIKDVIVVKHLRMKSDGTVLMKNDKRSYDDLTVSKDDPDSPSILGRVVWIGKRV